MSSSLAPLWCAHSRFYGGNSAGRRENAQTEDTLARANRKFHFEQKRVLVGEEEVAMSRNVFFLQRENAVGDFREFVTSRTHLTR